MDLVWFEMQRDLGATNISIDVLRSFVAVLDIGSIAKAADRLCLTHAGLNAQIKKLQQHVGDILFLRVESALKLTDKGEVLLGYARRILEMNDKIISLTGRNPNRHRIGIPKVYAGTFLEAANLACAKAVPGQLPAFLCGTSDELAKSLLQSFLDVAVLTEQASLPTATEFGWAESLVWACAPNFSPKPGCPLPLISSANGTTDQLAAEALFDANVQYEIVFITADWNVRMAAAMAGLGYVIAPQRVIPAELRVANEGFLPELRDLQCAIHVGPQIDVKKIRPLLMQLADVFIPRADNKRHACGAELFSTESSCAK